MAQLKADETELIAQDTAEFIYQRFEESDRALDSLEAICEEIGYDSSHVSRDEREGSGPREHPCPPR